MSDASFASGSLSNQNEKKPILYINILIVDGAAVVRHHVSKKVYESIFVPRPVKKAAAKRAAQAANLSSPQKIMRRISDQISQQITANMKTRGLTVETKEVFREGSFIVLEMYLLHVGVQELQSVCSDGGTCHVFSDWFRWSFDNIVSKGHQESFEQEYLPRIVAKEMASEMQKIMGEEFEKEKIEAEITVLKEKHQARFFFSKVQEIRQTDEKAKRNTPLRRRISSMSSNDSTNQMSRSARSTDTS